MKLWRPQKAPTLSIKQEQIEYPMLASYKLDGFRCTIIDQSPQSTSNIPLPTQWARVHYCHPDFEGIDGELVKVNPTPGRVYNETYSAVMTHGSMEPLVFHVFDIVEGGYYGGRLERLQKLCYDMDHIQVLEQRPVSNWEEVLEFEEEALSKGYEGVMLRSRSAYYKQGRCTLNEYNIFKLVRHLSAEAEILGVYEQLENTNEKLISETGLSKRSTHKAGKVGKNTLGGFYCRNLTDGVEFKMGTGRGLDAKTREEIWHNQEQYIGRIARYICKPYGKKDKPRQPIWNGWRATIDMDSNIGVCGGCGEKVQECMCDEHGAY